MSAAVDRRLVHRLRGLTARHAATAGLPPSRAGLRGVVEGLLVTERVLLPEARRVALIEAVLDETVGLGPLEPLLRDPSITEIMVNGPRDVWLERDGRIDRSDAPFDDTAHLMHVIDRMLGPLGRRVDDASPMVDARLADGSRINVIIPPLSLDGPILTVRRFASAVFDIEELLRRGTLTQRQCEVVRTAVADRRNILVTGGTGSGKTTTLAALCSFIPGHERIVTIEDAAELRLDLPHVVRLESRPAGVEGRGAVTIRALVRNALRMRPDRIIVGEVRGGECVDMLAAMTTGHEGSLCTLHASSPQDAIRRLHTLALMGDVDLPFAAVADQVAGAIDMIVHQRRLADGTRRVVEIAEVEAGPGGAVLRPAVGTVVRGIAAPDDRGHGGPPGPSPG